MIPRTSLPDSTILFWLDPYRFISRTCKRFGSDLFATRFLLQRAICMRGRAAAELLCDGTRFMRRGAAPMRVQRTLFGRGGVQSLDSEAHRGRKAMFMSLVRPDRVEQFCVRLASELRAASLDWERRGRATLYPEMRRVLTRSVCAWAGVPLDEREVGWRTAELTALFDRAASVGPPYWWSRLARILSERWCARLIEEVRAGRRSPTADSALSVVARHRDPDGWLLDLHTAAVELLNVLRPVLAISVFVVFVAHAIHEHPEVGHRLALDDAFTHAFVEEVRRFYPFFPVVAARVKKDFTWNGFHFARGIRVLLDLHGTNRDGRIWNEPDTFRPERFLGAHVDPVSPFSFIPQGPGDPNIHHRCPGEPVTVEGMRVAARFLASEIRYAVPPQDLRIDWRRMPALPRSRFVLADVRRSDQRESRRSSRAGGELHPVP